MTATYDRAEIERLCREVMEDNELMLAAFREFGDSHLIRTKHGTYGTAAVVTALERLRPMANQLKAASLVIDASSQQAERQAQKITDLGTKLEAAQREVERLTRTRHETRIDELLGRLGNDLTEEDFAALTLACADQAGISAEDQAAISRMTRRGSSGSP